MIFNQFKICLICQLTPPIKRQRLNVFCEYSLTFLMILMRYCFIISELFINRKGQQSNQIGNFNFYMNTNFILTTCYIAICHISVLQQQIQTNNLLCNMRCLRNKDFILHIAVSSIVVKLFLSQNNLFCQHQMDVHYQKVIHLLNN